MGNNAAVISLQNGPVVEGDVKVMFESSAVSVLPASSQISSAFMFLHVYFQGLPKGYEDVPFYFWFNTSFVENNKWVLVLFSVFFFFQNSHLKLCRLHTGCFCLEKSWTTLTSRRPGTSTKRTLASRCSSQSHK